MGIKKWMSFNRRMYRLVSSPFLTVFLLGAPAFADGKTFDLMITPGVVIPAGNGLFLPAPSSSLVLDFLPRKDIVLFAQGEYTSVTVRDVEPIHLYDGSLGAGYKKPLSDRLSVRGDLFAGVYGAKRTGGDTSVNLSGISAGVRASVQWRLSPLLSAGLQATLRHFAYTPEPFLNGIGAGLSVALDLTELFAGKARLDAETTRMDPVFPVFYSRYENSDFASVRLTNLEDAAITDVTVSFFLEQYMSRPGICAAFPSVSPGSSVDIPVKAFFESSMLELSEKTQAEAKLTVRYRYLGSRRETEIPLTVPVYHRNAMSWDDDRRAAAFVSARDPAALWFAKYVSSAVNQDFRNGINRNLQYAMGIFDSLKNYGLSYVVDPSSAYADNAESASAIDFLQYPYQTLMYRGGDCDDLSILWCSLLEAIDVESAFITVPGHIFIAFSTGLDETTARSQFAESGNLIFRDGIAWIPLEITLTREDFNKAWRIAAKEWRDTESRGTAAFYPVKEAWSLYPPVSVPGAVSRFTLPEEKQTLAAFNKTLDGFVAREIKTQVDSLQKQLARKDSADLRNQLGILYARYGVYDKARLEFEKAKALGGGDAAVNLANLSFIGGDYEASLSGYSAVLSSDPQNRLALLGAARSCYELDDFETSDGLFSLLTSLDPSLAAKYSYLNSFFDTTGRAWSLSQRLETTLWSVPRTGKDFYVAAIPPAQGSEARVTGSGSSQVQGPAAPSVRDLTSLAAKPEDPLPLPVQEPEPAEAPRVVSAPAPEPEVAVSQESVPLNDMPPEAGPEPETAETDVPPVMPAAETVALTEEAPAMAPVEESVPAEDESSAPVSAAIAEEPPKVDLSAPTIVEAESVSPSVDSASPVLAPEEPQPPVPAKIGLTSQLSIDKPVSSEGDALSRLLTNAAKGNAKPPVPEYAPAPEAEAPAIAAPENAEIPALEAEAPAIENIPAPAEAPVIAEVPATEAETPPIAVPAIAEAAPVTAELPVPEAETPPIAETMPPEIVREEESIIPASPVVAMVPGAVAAPAEAPVTAELPAPEAVFEAPAKAAPPAVAEAAPENAEIPALEAEAPAIENIPAPAEAPIVAEVPAPEAETPPIAAPENAEIPALEAEASAIVNIPAPAEAPVVAEVPAPEAEAPAIAAPMAITEAAPAIAETTPPEIVRKEESIIPASPVVAMVPGAVAAPAEIVVPRTEAVPEAPAIAVPMAIAEAAPENAEIPALEAEASAIVNIPAPAEAPVVAEVPAPEAEAPAIAAPMAIAEAAPAIAETTPPKSVTDAATAPPAALPAAQPEPPREPAPALAVLDGLSSLDAPAASGQDGKDNPAKSYGLVLGLAALAAASLAALGALARLLKRSFGERKPGKPGRKESHE